MHVAGESWSVLCAHRSQGSGFEDFPCCEEDGGWGGWLGCKGAELEEREFGSGEKAESLGVVLRGRGALQLREERVEIAFGHLGSGDG